MTLKRIKCKKITYLQRQSNSYYG